jgi:imidazoleglycerol-phosphate dehydratase
MKQQEIVRETGETKVKLVLTVGGSGGSDVRTGVSFFDHMLQLLARHSRMDIRLEARGDLEVDDHHVVEDVGIVLGQALAGVLGDKAGMERYGSVVLPMDEALVAVAVDLSGRSAFSTNYRPRRERVGGLSTELVNHFFGSLASQAKINLHFHFLENGKNEHHRIEAMFKGFARALRMAVRPAPDFEDEVPSTKGRL